VNDLDQGFEYPLNAIRRLLRDETTVYHVLQHIGNDVRAHHSVPAAICAFLLHADSFTDALTFAVMLGGDTDTIGSMTGAIAGALHGLQAIPEPWLSGLQDQGKDADYVVCLAHRLCECQQRLSGTSNRMQASGHPSPSRSPRKRDHRAQE
jgi:poly(ADP-ribose) glycohydrolase ARH3